MMSVLVKYWAQNYGDEDYGFEKRYANKDEKLPKDEDYEDYFALNPLWSGK